MIFDGNNPRLQFGALDLAGLSADGQHPDYELYALAAEHDTTWGNPEPDWSIIKSQLSDGDIVSLTRHGNREASVAVAVTGVDGLALAQAEARLYAEVGKRSTLIWTPPDTWGPPTVFDVLGSSMEHKFDDVAEARLRRIFVVKMALYPFPRSLADAAVAATGSGVDPVESPAEVVVTNADTTAGFVWVAPGTTLSDGGAYVQVTLQSDGDASLGYDIGSVTDYSATPLLVVDADQSYAKPEAALQAWLPTSSTFALSRSLPLLSSIPSPLSALWRRYIFDASAYASSVQRIRVQGGCGKSHSHASERLKVTRIAFMNGQAAYTGTTRQLERSMVVRGSARTQASLQLTHTTSTLGSVLVWSGPEGNAVPFRANRFNGGTVVADTSLVSGAYEDIEPTDFVAEFPQGALREGSYAVMGRFKVAGAGSRTVDITAQTYINGVAVGSAVTESTVISVGTSYATYMLGTIPLPPTVSASPNATVRVSLGALTELLMDEAWVFNITDGHLTWVTCSEKNLWIDAPTIDDPRPRLWAGSASDKSDAYDLTSSASSWGAHEFDPGSWSAFTVTSNALNAALSATYPIRWHTHAAE